MIRKAFTLIEVMAVVVLLGLLAGAVAWSMADDLRRNAQESAAERVMSTDELARLAARASGQPCVLRFDLDAQRIARSAINDRGQMGAAHDWGLGADWAIAKVIVLRPDASAEAAISPVRRHVHRAGAVELRISADGWSPTYLVRLDRVGGPITRDGASGSGQSRQWIVVAGLTGATRVIYDQQELDNLLATLQRPGIDAD